MGLLATSTISCEDLLDTEPKQSITPELALSGISGYEGLLFSTYTHLKRFNQYGQQMLVDPEILADNLVLVNRTGRFEGEFENAAASHINIWGMGTDNNLSPTRYQAINELNQVIAGIDNVEGDDAEKNSVKGEAYFLRALSYHDLHRVYSYEPGREVNGFNLGVILRTEPVTNVTESDLRERSTNVEGYELMVSDLENAIALLPATVGDFPYRPNKATAQALLARVNLYRGDWAGAIAAADAALAGTTAVLTSGDDYLNSWAMVPHPESLLEIELRPNVGDWNSVDGVNESMKSMTQPEDGGQFVVGLSPDLVAAYEEGDIRTELYDSTSVGGQEQFMSLKWPGSRDGIFMDNLPVIRYSEVLLIRAEAKAHSGDAAGARTDLNTFRAARGLGEVSGSLAGSALVDSILDERRKEFVLEGHRFFDLKRLGRDISKPDRASLDELPYDNYRVLAPIPFAEIRLNENLTQNPGYNN